MEPFVNRKDLIRGFAGAMNLISPEVESHHEKVAFFTYQLADAMGLSQQEKQLALFSALLHDIGGTFQKEAISLVDLELRAADVAKAGSAMLKAFSPMSRFSEIVASCQTPWDHVRKMHSIARLPQLLGQIVHLADVVTLLLNDSKPVLNQVAYVKECIHRANAAEFHPDVLEAFDRLCRKEAVWLELLYDPQRFLDYIEDDKSLTLDETMQLTEFMSRIVDFRSPFTAMHSAGVASTAVSLAKLSGMSDQECKMMRIAGYLHDVGKLKISNEILEKPGKLTDEEFNIMKEHAYFSYVILHDIKGFEEISEWAARHHEKLDGSGYPFHLTADQLSEGSRIMTVADIFSAITEERPYRKGMQPDQVLRILHEDADNGKISAEYVELLADHYDQINEQRAIESKAASRKYQESLSQRDGSL